MADTQTVGSGREAAVRRFAVTRLRLGRFGPAPLGLAIGLVLLAASAVVVRTFTSGPSYTPHPPSVQAFPFQTIRPPVPSSAAAPAPAAAPAASPQDAVARFLTARSTGDTAASYALLERRAQDRLGGPADWASRQAGLPRPTGFTVLGVDPGDSADTRQVRAEVTYEPSLDDFTGFVPARREEIWQVTDLAGGWRVAAEPTRVAPDLPDPSSAVPVVTAWGQALARCDAAAAEALQIPAGLLGDSRGFDPCATHDAGTVGAPRRLDPGPESAAYLAAFGSDVGVWARQVPLRLSSATSTAVLVAVAPLGDSWRVLGVTPDPEGGTPAG